MELVLEELFDRVVVLSGWVGRNRSRVGAKRAGGDRGGVDDGDDAIDGDAVAHARPGEGADERLRQGEARGLDDDVVGRRVAGEEHLHRRQELVGDRAADAAIGELDDLIGPAVAVAAIGEQRAVEAHVAELVDDDGDAPAAGAGDQVADERRLAGAEEAGDDGGGDAGGHACAGLSNRPTCHAREGGHPVTAAVRSQFSAVVTGSPPSRG